MTSVVPSFSLFCGIWTSTSWRGGKTTVEWSPWRFRARNIYWNPESEQLRQETLRDLVGPQGYFRRCHPDSASDKFNHSKHEISAPGGLRSVAKLALNIVMEFRKEDEKRKRVDWLIKSVIKISIFFAKSINFYCKTSYRPPQHVLGRRVALLGRGLAELGEGGSSSMKNLYYIFNWKQIIICWGRGVAVLGRAVAVLGRAVAAPGEGPGRSYLIFWH